jgi:hypothetical protein
MSEERVESSAVPSPDECRTIFDNLKTTGFNNFNLTICLRLFKFSWEEYF